MKLQNLSIDDTLVITNLRVPETEIKGIIFSELDLKNVKVKVIDDYKGNKLCLFDRFLFESTVNKKSCKWENTALCKYLSTAFNKALKDIFECEVETNLLTGFEIFGEGKQRSNFPIYPKKYKLGKDRIACNPSDNKLPDYWLGFEDPSVLSKFDYFSTDGFTVNYNFYNRGAVRPAFLLRFNQERFSGSSLDIAKQNKILEIQKVGIEGFYRAYEITDYELDLFVDCFTVEIKGQKFLFDYENFRNPESIEKLKKSYNEQ